MAIVDTVKDFFSLGNAGEEPEEEYAQEETDLGFGDDEEYFEDRDEDDYETSPRFSFGSRNRMRSNRESYSRRSEGSFFDSFKDEPVFEREKSGASTHIVLMRPERFAEVKRIADHLVSNRSLILNFDRMNSGEIRRTLDFLSGAAYAKGGKVEKLSASTVFFAVGSVDLEGHIEELSEIDSYFN